MGAMTDYLENALLNHVLQKGAANFTPPEELYIGLFVLAPDDAGGGIEVDAAGYQRMPLDFTLADGGEAHAVDVVEFPPAEEDWGTIVGAAIFDAAEDGNMLFHGSLTSPRTITSGETFRYPVGNLLVRFK